MNLTTKTTTELATMLNQIATGNIAADREAILSELMGRRKAAHSCDRCESRGQFRVPSVVSLDGAYFCRPCADFYKEEVQRKAADACKNADFHWHQVDGCCGSCHQVWGR